MVPAEQSELDWLAFRYVAGEMTADEAVAFEGQLATEQAAREAVSRAVELTERLTEAAPVTQASVKLADSAPPTVHPVGIKSLLRAAQPLGWMAAGAAATLLIMSIWPWPARPRERGTGTERQAAATQRPDADAALWARLQAGGQWASPDLARWLEESTALAGQERDDAFDPGEVPSWIFATTNSRPK